MVSRRSITKRVGTNTVSRFQHGRHGLLVQVAAVLDGARPGTQSGHDPRLAVTVGGHHPFRSARLLHDGGELLVGELLVERVVELGEDTS